MHPSSLERQACVINPTNSLPRAPGYAVMAGITALAVNGALMVAGQAVGIVGSKILAEAATFIVLIWLYPEPQGRRWSLNSVVAFLLTGVAIGTVWVGFIGLRLANSEASEWTNFPFFCSPWVYQCMHNSPTIRRKNCAPSAIPRHRRQNKFIPGKHYCFHHFRNPPYGQRDLGIFRVYGSVLVDGQMGLEYLAARDSSWKYQSVDNALELNERLWLVMKIVVL